MADDAISGSHILDRLSKRHSLVLTAGRERDAEHFADKFRQAGLPVNDYRKPVCLSFHGASGSYIGSLILWTKATSPPIDTATVAHLEALRPFFAYVFTSALARFSLTNMQFFNTLHSIISLTASSDLSRREREVLMCRFNGMSAAATAALLHISSSTVRRHLREMNKVLQDSHTLTRVLGSPIPPRTRRSKKKQTAYPPMISNR